MCGGRLWGRCLGDVAPRSSASSRCAPNQANDLPRKINRNLGECAGREAGSSHAPWPSCQVHKMQHKATPSDTWQCKMRVGHCPARPGERSSRSFDDHYEAMEKTVANESPESAIDGPRRWKTCVASLHFGAAPVGTTAELARLFLSRSLAHLCGPWRLRVDRNLSRRCIHVTSWIAMSHAQPLRDGNVQPKTPITIAPSVQPECTL